MALDVRKMLLESFDQNSTRLSARLNRCKRVEGLSEQGHERPRCPRDHRKARRRVAGQIWTGTPPL